jgi:hypothetical protein
MKGINEDRGVNSPAKVIGWNTPNLAVFGSNNGVRRNRERGKLNDF